MTAVAGPGKITSDDTEDSLSSSDEDDRAGPPPVLQIEKSFDINAMKTAIMSAIENPTTMGPAKPSVDLETKEQFHSFKERFENIDKLKAAEEEDEKKVFNAGTEIQGFGRDSITKAKDVFNPINGQESSNNCTACNNDVYSVDKILIEKRLFHKNCFNCTKCQQRLNLQTYAAHDGHFFCKLHAIERIRPEMAADYASGKLTDADIDAAFEEQGGHVLVSKPKVQHSSVVKSSLKTSDDFDNLAGSLQNRKSEWTKSAQDMGRTDKKSMDDNEAKLFEQGRVKAHSTKFTEGQTGVEQQDDDEEGADQENQTNRDIVKSSKKKEKVNVEVGARAIVNKWESGTVERAQGETEDRTQELDELKKNVSVKLRFKEKTAADAEQDEPRRKSTVEEEVDTSFSHAAKESFMKGTAFQDARPVEKLVATDDIKFAEMGNMKERFEKMPLDAEKPTEKSVVVDVRCAEMGGLKATFEQATKGPLDDEAEQTRKKEQIDKEFQQIKEVRKQMKQSRGKKTSLSEVAALTEETSLAKDNVNNLSNLGDKNVELKVIQAKTKKDAPFAASTPTATKTLEQSKWAKEKIKTEPVNKRTASIEEHESADDEDDDYEVKNLLNKFKDIEQGKPDERKGPKPMRQITPPPEGYVNETQMELKEKEILPSVSPEELANIRVEAKNLKAKFEHVATSIEKSTFDPNVAEEKKRQLEEEFKRLKEMKQEMKQMESETAEADTEPTVKEKDADLALAAEHGQKSRAKWEKIERKEAKKAQKAAAAIRRPSQRSLND